MPFANGRANLIPDVKVVDIPKIWIKHSLGHPRTLGQCIQEISVDLIEALININ